MRFTEFGQTVHALIPRPDPQLLSIVIPAYNEGPTVPFLRAELTQFIDGLPFRSEVVIVNDGSSDETLPRLLEWALDDPRIRVVHLSRNFGHQIAATAGLDKASGDAIVLIDADLQDPLPVILSMLERYREGYDVVYGQRESRDGESAFKLATAWIFYRLMRTLVYKSLPPDVGDFRLLSRQCLDALRHMREQHRFLRGMVTWVGYSQTAVRYKRAKRVAGETKYPLRKMLKFAWTAAVSFSTLPLKASMMLGLLMAGLGAEEAIRAILSKLLGWPTVRGWSSLMILTSMASGTVLLCLGVLGEYIGRIYEEVKARPLYLVSAVLTSEQLEPSQRVTQASESKH